MCINVDLLWCVCMQKYVYTCVCCSYMYDDIHFIYGCMHIPRDKENTVTSFQCFPWNLGLQGHYLKHGTISLFALPIAGCRSRYEARQPIFGIKVFFDIWGGRTCKPKSLSKKELGKLLGIHFLLNSMNKAYQLLQTRVGLRLNNQHVDVFESFLRNPQLPSRMPQAPTVSTDVFLPLPLGCLGEGPGSRTCRWSSVAPAVRKALEQPKLETCVEATIGRSTRLFAQFSLLVHCFYWFFVGFYWLFRDVSIVFVDMFFRDVKNRMYGS